MFLQMGVAISFLVPPAVVDDVQDKTVIGEQLQVLYFGLAIAASTVFFLILIREYQ